MGQTPSNPLNKERMAQVADIAQDVIDTFIPNYLLSFKMVAIKQAESEKKRMQKLIKAESGLLPPRPRKENPFVKPREFELTSEIKWWEKLDKDIDPYIAYAVESKYGDENTMVYRRYNNFRELDSQLSKDKPGEAKFPGTKFLEGRKFDESYLKDRREKLQKYLDVCCKDAQVSKMPKFRQWLGLDVDRDPMLWETFQKAYYLTKRDLWIWKKIVYDTEGEAMGKLVVEEIRRKMFPDIEKELPNNRTVRKKTLQAVYSSIMKTVNPIVEKGWEKARKELEPVAKDTVEIIGTQSRSLMSSKKKAKEQLGEKMDPILEPISKELKAVLDTLFQKILESMVNEILYFKKDYDKVLDSLEKLIKTGDMKYSEDAKEKMKDLRASIKKRVVSIAEDLVDKCLGEVKAKAKIKEIIRGLGPLKKLANVIEAGVDIFLDPIPVLNVIDIMVKHRNLMMEAKITGQTKELKQMLDKEEADVLWHRWWTRWKYRDAAWDLYWRLGRHSELGVIARDLRRAGFDYAEMQAKFVKKYSWRFGDEVWRAAKTVHTSEEGENIISKAFLDAYNYTTNQFRFGTIGILKDTLRASLKVSILGAIDPFLRPKLESAMEEIEKTIPHPLNKILDMRAIMNEVLEEKIADIIKHLLKHVFYLPLRAALDKRRATKDEEPKDEEKEDNEEEPEDTKPEKNES